MSSSSEDWEEHALSFMSSDGVNGLAGGKQFY